MAFVANMKTKPTFDDAAYLKLRERRLADQVEERKKTEAAKEKETAAPAESSNDSYTANYLKLRAQRLAGQSANQPQSTPGSTEFLENTQKQQGTAASVGFADSITAPHRVAELTAQKARQEYETAKAQEQYSGHAALVNMAAAAQPGSTYNLPQQESDDLRALREKAEAAEAEAQRAQQDYRISQDQRTYERDMAQIQALSPDARSALETYARLYKLARNSSMQGQYLNAKMALGKAGLSAEQMDALAETWTRSRNAENMAQKQEDYAAMAEENPLLHNVLSVPAGIAGALTGTAAVIGEAIDRADGSQYSTLDPNLPGYTPSVYTGTVRQTTAENIDDGSMLGKAGATLYSASMSAADNLARIVTLGPTGSLAFAGMSTFQNSVRETTQRGGTPAQAYAMGVATAGLEVLTEKVSLDSLISTKTPENIVQLLKNAAIQGGIEVSEEELNFAGGLIADAVIMGGNSEFNRTVADLVAGGMSAEDAKRQALMNNLSQAANVAAQAFLSGGLMSGAQAGFQVAANGGFSAPQTVPAPTTEQNTTPAEIPAQPPQAAPVQPVQTAPQAQETQAPSRYVAPDGLRYEDMTPAQQMAADMEMAVETLKNRQASGAEGAADTSSIKDQLRSSQNELNAMQPVTTIQVSADYSQMNKVGKMNWVIEKLRPTGYQVDRKGFGVINFAKNLLKAAFKYFDKGGVEEATFEALPYVLENGVEISARENHKGREYGTVTFAAPVVINGKRGNMAVVVKQTTGNYYKVHRILTPDGSVFRLDGKTNEAESTAVGESPETGSLAAPKDSASNISINDSSGDVKSEPTESATPATLPSGAVSPDESVGAAPQGFDPYTNLQYEYGNQPDRANDFRPVNVPKRDTYGRNVTEFAANAYGAEAVPDSFIPIAEQLIVDGALGFDTRTNAESLNAAAREIDSRGMAKAKADITKAVTSGKIGENDIAKAMLLFTHYANKGGTYAKDAAAELFVDLSQMATRAGRDLQLFSMLRRLTPQGQLQTVKRKVERFVEQTNQTRSEKDQAEVEIPQDLQEEFEEAAKEATKARESGDESAEKEAQRRADEAEQAIYEAAAAQIPGTVQEKWDAWRYMAMLGNPKTQIRNILGNAAFRPFVAAKRFLNAAAQSMLKPQNRTTALLGFSEADNALRDFAAQDAVSQEKRMEYTGTTGDSATTDIQEQRKIFDNKALEFLRTKLSDLMGTEDMFFKRMEYRAALASYLKAKGVTAAQLEAGESKDILEDARSHAVQEAMKATFNDRNALSDFVVNLRYKGNNPVGKAMNALGEGILPFRRTPANIIARGLEYNPVNFIRGVTNAITKVRTGDMSAADAIDQMSSGLVGTAAMALGYALASGIFGVRLVGAEDNEDDLRSGHQAYALEIGGISYTVDWAAPSNLPLFMGANLYSALNSEDRSTDVSAFTAFLDSTLNTLEPMLELSCLSSLNDLLQDARYADEGREIYSILSSTATGYFLQGIPTLLGQIEQSTEAEKKSIYAESTDPVLGEFQRVLGRATQKIPGVDLFQAARVDEWGRTEQENPTLRAVEAFVSPGYVSEIDGSAVETELRRLNLAQDLNASPRTASKTVSVDGKEVRLTAQQWEQTQTTQGQTAHRIVTDLISSPDYDLLTDAEKASAIRSAYDYAREHARVSHVDGYSDYSAKWMEGIENSEAAVILDRAKADISGLTDARYAAAKELGISFQDMQAVSAAVGDPETKYDAFRTVLKSAPAKDREAWLSVYGMTDSQLEVYREAVSGGLKPADYVGYLESVSAIDGAISKAVEAWNSGSLADPATMESAYKVWDSLSKSGKQYFLDNAGGRTEAFIRAREADVSSAAFLSAYDTYREISNGPGTAADHAEKFAAALDNMVRAGRITKAQREVLWDSLGYYTSLRQEAQKYHDLHAEGLSPDTATHILDTMDTLKPESGYTNVRDIQKLEAIVSDTKLSSREEEAALRAYLSPSAEDKMDAVLDMGMAVDAYVSAYRMYMDESGTGKKARTIAAYQEKFGLSYEEAKALYEIYG